MIIHNVSQGTPEWFQCRSGIPTASCFSKIVTPTGKLSTQSAGYASFLLAERMLNKPLEQFQKTYWMERGQELEADAVAMYEFMYSVKTEVAGFITNDEATAGCSPDRFVGDEGLVEIKCPAPWTHVENLVADKIDKDYIPQVQGQMLITGRKWVDWFSYYPDLTPCVIRTYRDEDYIQKLAEALAEFDSVMKSKIEQLKEKGAY